ncbi:MAG: glucose-1-phosphate adenylyltransferase [Candidatus Omnitrophota bacterium]
MLNNKKCLAFVIAGGKGERLSPLTKERTKPSVPFGSKYRIVDFVLSNLINSGIYSIYVLVQYKSQSLIEHIRTSRRRSGLAQDHFITVVPAQMRTAEGGWYKGTADAIYQNINLILDSKPDIVAVFAADHIYRMDIRQMINFHLRKKADVTVATLPVSINEAHHFGIAQVTPKCRIKNFIEKPKNPKAVLDTSSNIVSSMGNYIFDAGILVDILLKDAQLGKSAHDFGKSIIPALIKTHKVFSYSFANNKIPGIKKYEEKAYWRDVGTISSFMSANMDLLGESPILDLNNRAWPIMTADIESSPSRIVSGEVKDSVIGEGVFINDSHICKSIIGRGVTIEKGSSIENSIIMGHTKIGKNCHIKNSIIDRYNIVKENTTIGFDEANDKKQYCVDKESGIVLLARGERNLL